MALLAWPAGDAWEREQELLAVVAPQPQPCGEARVAAGLMRPWRLWEAGSLVAAGSSPLSLLAPLMPVAGAPLPRRPPPSLLTPSATTMPDPTPCNELVRNNI